MKKLWDKPSPMDKALIGANVGPSKECEYSSGCDRPSVQRSLCQEHYDMCYKPVPKRKDNYHFSRTDVKYGSTK